MTAGLLVERTVYGYIRTLLTRRVLLSQQLFDRIQADVAELAGLGRNEDAIVKRKVADLNLAAIEAVVKMLRVCCAAFLPFLGSGFVKLSLWGGGGH